MPASYTSYPSNEIPARVERLWTLMISACLGVVFVVILNLAGPWQIKSTAPSGKVVVDVDISRILVD